MDYKLFLIAIISFLLNGCLQSPSTKRNDGVIPTSNNNPIIDITNPENLYWFTNSATSKGLLQLKIDNTSGVYLRGKNINNYLSSDSNFYTDTTKTKLRPYCLIVNYKITDAKSQLRIKATPIKFKGENLFSLNFSQSETNNQTLCQGTVSRTDSSGVLENIASVNSAFLPQNICPTCTGTIHSLDNQIFLYNSVNNLISDNTKISQTVFDFSHLDLEFLISSTPGTSDEQCNIDCIATGIYDCCIDKQCAKNGALRPNAQDQEGYEEAVNDVTTNPLNFIKYDHIYFVCKNMQPIPPDPVEPTPSDPVVTLEQLKKDYECMIGATLTPPDYSSCTNSPTYSGSGTSSDYDYVKLTVWKRCRCDTSSTNHPLICVNFSLKPVYQNPDNPTTTPINYICDTKDPNVSTTYSYKDLSVSAKTIPHRFYRQDSGDFVAEDQIKTLSVAQEGEEFTYTDYANYLEPISGAFNMNAILGPITVDLSKARPAKEVLINYDQTYIITVKANSGYAYSPCFMGCSSDSWFSGYSAHPRSVDGLGLRANPITTSRTGDNNYGFKGNYEDTHFGRACYIPPTMIPFSHYPNATLSTQRKNRLETQAALFANGYQKDWFGFNKGALIGSFNGVSWFALGTIRKVRSTSTKLMLAINAPFADLATSSAFTVTILPEVEPTSATEYDYDPSLPESPAALQNLGASCQRYHMCEKDSDCITQLGWEYMCIDVANYKTHWPKFDMDGNEIANTYIQKATFTNTSGNNKILQSLPTLDGTKRCVYRGAGAPCKKDYSNLTAKLQKNFTCAPNFYCADLDEAKFNQEVVRTPKWLEDFLFGMDANVLGRPLYYIGATSNLTDTIRTNLSSNLLINSSVSGDSASNWGICLSGRTTTSSAQITQHQNADPDSRTDYVSQIGGCNSSLTGTNRVRSCPVLNDDEDDVDNAGNYIFSPTLEQRKMQNGCGLESLDASSNSPFFEIENDTIPNLTSFLLPGIAKDGCVRRAGSVCHTDLDCAPNIYHSLKAYEFDLSYFGNTLAEQKYWQENLICGQAELKPVSTQSSNFLTYDLKKNRCCRPINETLTMYTSVSSTLLDQEMLEESDTSINLLINSPGETDPTLANRYSRFVNANATTLATNPPVVTVDTTPKSDQWKIINETGTKSCCGGGWIRLFSDGTHDWTITNRLSFSIENFACLNYENDLYVADDRTYLAVNSNYSKDLGLLCDWPYPDSSGNRGCLQIPISFGTGYSIIAPKAIANNNAELSTLYLPNDATYGVQRVSSDSPYLPPAHNSTNPRENFFKAGMTTLELRIPSYISKGNLEEMMFGEYPDLPAIGDRVHVSYYRLAGDNTYISCGVDEPFQMRANCTIATALMDKEYCIFEDGGYTILRLQTNIDGNCGAGTPFYLAGVKIKYRKMNTKEYGYNDGLPINPYGGPFDDIDETRQGLTAGNAMYYLTKLGRFDLLGIPQIFYEPLYCNSNMSKLVPGLFKDAAGSLLYTRTDFDAAAFNYSGAINSRSLMQIYDASAGNDDYANPGANAGKIVYQDKVAITPIFKGHSFTCCLKLGQETTSSEKCCSNFSMTVNGKTYCRLPNGVDLNVYFNKFVSSEGVGSTLPGGGLDLDTDFIPETGEPKLTNSVSDKLVTLGETFCQTNAVRQGAAFGYYYPQPNTGIFGKFSPFGATRPADVEEAKKAAKVFSIIDSINDYNENDAGWIDSALKFTNGYRWNHHWYCDGDAAD